MVPKILIIRHFLRVQRKVFVGTVHPGNNIDLMENTSRHESRVCDHYLFDRVTL